METRQLTIREAATHLGVPIGTINRWIRAGTLTETQRDGVPAQSYIETPAAETRDRADRDSETAISELWDRLHDTEADRDHWRHQAETLSRNVSDLTATIYQFSNQKAMDAPTTSTAKRSPWWMFWRPSVART